MHTKFVYLSLILCAVVLHCQAARILVFVPTASSSHQAVSRILSVELAKRGHEVVVITPIPDFPKGKAPANLTEIDVHDAGYAAKSLGFAETVTGRNNDVLPQIIKFFRHLFTDMFDAEINTEEVQALMKDKSKKFDLLILEACTRATLALSHVFNAPVIMLSSFGNLDMFTDYTGSAAHPLLFPTVIHQKLYNLTLWEKVDELYKHYMFEKTLISAESLEDKVLQKNFGPNFPPLKKLKNNVAMVFLVQHHLMDNNRPVPPNMVYLGGIYPSKNTEPLPKDLETYLNASVNGVVYVSYGTTVFPSLLPQKTIQTIVNVLGKLPYDVLLKWDTDYLPGIHKNTKLFKWLPQPELLRHPKIKLFITQGGIQSTDDAIAAGVPLVGMPMLGDQWYNVEQYIRFKIGLRVDVESVTEEKMLKAIHTVINDESYRRNIATLRTELMDQPEPALDRAVWWAEYVIRNKGAPRLRAPTALISYWDYFEGDLVLMLASLALVVVGVAALLFYYLVLFCCRVYKKTKID